MINKETLAKDIKLLSAKNLNLRLKKATFKEMKEMYKQLNDEALSYTKK